MNWFTREYHGKDSFEMKKKLVEQDGGCEHVEADPNLVAYVRYEKDSFGPVSSHAVCEACDKLADEEEGNEIHTCTDCKQDKPLKEGVLWKWYDFYAAQGDEPLFVCNCCKKEPKHLQRVAADRRAYDEEFGNDGDGEHDQESTAQPEEPKPVAQPEAQKPTVVKAWPFPTDR